MTEIMMDTTAVWREYTEGTLKTWNHSPLVSRWRFELLNAALGVAGETGEILEDVEGTLLHDDEDFRARLRGEIGDVLYYIARVAEHWTQNDGARTFGELMATADETARAHYESDPAVNIEALAIDLSFSGAKVAELTKKMVFHSKPIPEDALNALVFDVCYDIATFALVAGTTLQAIAEANLAKLAARYPQGFTAGGGIRSNEA